MIIVFYFVSAFLHARGTYGSDIKILTIYSLKGPSGVGMIRLFEEPPKISRFDVKVEALAQADLMAARFLSGQALVGILPPNMAAKIRAMGRDVQSAAVIGEGMLTLLSSDPGISSFEDLRGKTVEVAGQGATPDFVFRKILSSRFLVPERDVKLSYSLANPEIAQSLIAARVSIALLPEPFATMARLGRPELKSIADIQEEWVKLGGTTAAGNYPMTLLVVDTAFASANPAALDLILSKVKESIEWVRSHPAEAGVMAEKHDMGIKANVVAAALPKSNYVFVPASEARPSMEALFRVFLEYEPASIGGALPEDGFYR